MYTQCPGCRTVFEINEDALQVSLGIVRCGHCARRFDALRTLSDSLPLAPGEALPERDPAKHAPTLTVSVSPIAVAATSDGRQESDADAGTSPATNPRADDTWLVAFPDHRAQALIADAAGIPADALAGDPAWEITQLPVQARFADLEASPVAVAASGPEAAGDLSSADATDPDEALESAALGESWNIEFANGTDHSAPDGEPEDGIATASPEVPSRAGDATAGTASDPGPMPFHRGPDSADAAGAGDLAATGGDRVGADEDLPTPVGAPADAGGESAIDEAVPAIPVYVPPRRRRIRRRDWWWALGCLVLALSLAAQLAWAERVALVRDPATRAWAMRACASMDCRLPPIRDLAKLELLSRDVRPDPVAARALMITATLRNDARFRQPWPIVVVELTDLDNNVVAMRRFRPAEYMPDPVRRAAGIAPGTTAAVAFEVADPGKRAVSFRFGFE
ncbi:MAG: zinc-ribbon domain-containing protein [Xanthomonadaceae bacterium]|nr:zinc-ribbon domain-containing protein [Xanthomonadaceae bacterium]